MMADSVGPPSASGQEGHLPVQPATSPAAASPATKLRPTRAWYWVALAVFVLGVVWLVGGLVMLGGRIDSFQRVALPGSGQVSLDHSGGYLIYYEGPGAAAGNIPAFRINVKPLSASAAVQGLETYGGSLTYSFGSREGRAVLTLQIASPGTFLIEAPDAPVKPGSSSLAIGSSIAGSIVGTALPGVVLMLAAVGGAIAVALVRRSRVRRVRLPAPPA
jgi:hypothetical protein